MPCTAPESPTVIQISSRPHLTSLQKRFQLLMTSQRELSLVLRGRRARGVWVIFICLSFWYSGPNLVLLCLYSIISDVTQCSFDIQGHLLVVKSRWHIVFHVFVNRCNQEGVGILLLLHIYCRLQSLCSVHPIWNVCIIFPISPYRQLHSSPASIRC